MKIIQKRLVVLGILMAACLSLIAIVSVNAVNSEISSQQIQRIRENCLSIKTTLNQLHASDALLRVNRGQIYESMSIKLMSKFNDRVSNNGMDNSKLVSVTNKYNSILDDFRSHYITYEESLSSAISIDCLKQPVSFYDAVAVADNNRSKVHSDIIKLNQSIDDYKETLKQFEENFLTGSKE